MHTDSIVLTAIVDACERRDAAVVDVPEARLNAIMDDLMLLKMTDEQLDALLKIDTSCSEHTTCEKEKKVLCLMLNKSLHGCVQSALLWHKLCSSTLVSLGFKLNLHDPCVANADIEASPCTTC